MSRAYRDEEPLATVSEIDLDQVRGSAANAEPLDLVFREGARLLLEAALRAEIDELLDRVATSVAPKGQRGTATAAGGGG